MAPRFPSVAYSPCAAMLAKMRPRAVMFSEVIQVVRVELNCPWTTENATNARIRKRDFMVIVMDGRTCQGRGSLSPQHVGYINPFDEAIPDRHRILIG